MFSNFNTIIILLYSSASLKFYDNVVQVTANQWYWNFSSNVLVETNFLNTFFFSSIDDVLISDFNIGDDIFFDFFKYDYFELNNYVEFVSSVNNDSFMIADNDLL